MNKRSLLLATCAAFSACLPTLSAEAQAAFPNKPVTIVVPGAPGGGGDFTARLLAEALTKSMGNPVVVENRAGAGGNIASTYVARAQPDGYTLLLAYSGTHVANPALYRNLQWDPVKSFTPVALLITAPQVIVVSPKVPGKTLAEFVSYARANPGKINYASSGNGTLQHIGAELLAYRTGTKMVHVPYKGAGAALTDLLSGQVELLITTPPAVVSHIRGGSLRALAIASKTRHPMLPEVPTTSEAGVKDVELDAWFALYAPAGTPAPVVDRLVGDIEKVVTSADFKRRAEESGTYATFKGPAELDKLTRSELTYWSDVVHKLDIKAE
ncbi:MAG: tripartite tricarboxylate transporter substrate binding protein [Gammaproteobacteria bacterium]|nr:tripartite tricarboxylate transporter substrate binding protein [Gammaproteobacteria bacterium]MBU1443822.1 tripartite tricarboxylate transporter substrate binding protein [Gammaproteobacteria bacterium]MBU2285703.1 tripartite tricarboxylate transporter substrate binding protein [Gammaproteobacteria bacterium]MBU2408690.1 tripartite tricarboxylate transporter substrate binding protein [Gammaproteobacteria bacterium]